MKSIKFLITSSRLLYKLIGFVNAIVYNIKLIKKHSLISFSSFVYGSELGSHVRIYDGVDLKNSTIGSYSYIGKNSKIYNAFIGNYCSIGANVKICLGKHPIGFFSTFPGFYSKNSYCYVESSPLIFPNEIGKVTVGNDVWIGTDAIILDDIKIGDGAIIAAGALVTKDVEPYAIVGGVPAKVIKYRFDSKIISELKLSKWWLQKHNELDLESLNNILSKHV